MAAYAVSKLPQAGDNRALVILLGMVLATMEARTTKDAWRGSTELSRTYLKFLADNGYPLSDIEHVVLRSRKADALPNTTANRPDDSQACRAAGPFMRDGRFAMCRHTPCAGRASVEADKSAARWVLADTACAHSLLVECTYSKRALFPRRLVLIMCRSSDRY